MYRFSIGPLELSCDVANIVSLINIDSEVDLYKMTKIFPEASYNPRKFPGVVMKLDGGNNTILVFQNGKMVATGFRNFERLRSVVHDTIARMRRFRVVCKNSKYEMRIVNILLRASVNTFIDVESAAEELDSAIYEPEIFPGLIYKPCGDNIAIIIYHTGKIVCTGCSDMWRLIGMMLNLINKLYEYGLMYGEINVDV